VSRKPDPDCPVCSVHQTGVLVDLSRATLNDLVEDFVKLELGYGDKDFVVNNEIGILYDADETENLSKKLSDLGRRVGSVRAPRADHPQASIPTASSPS